MSNAFLYVTGGCLIVSSALVHFFVARRRHRRDLREFLEPELRKRGVQFVSAVYPGIFKVGPFPKFEVTVGRPQSTVLGFRGEYSEYRIVTFKNGKDEAQQLWAKVDFELFRFARVRWRAEHKESLPPALLPILEA